MYGASEHWIIRDDAKMHLGDRRSVRDPLLAESQLVGPALRHWKVTGARFVGYRPRFSEWPRYMLARPGTIELQTEYLGG
jgi:hypothetical protein